MTGRPTPRPCAHIDRCLSCLACMTTCPSGVHYMHLVDHARAPYRGDLPPAAADRAAARAARRRCCPHPAGSALRSLGAHRPAVRALLAGCRAGSARMLELRRERACRRGAGRTGRVFPAEGRARERVALLAGCVQTVLDPAINDATIRLLTRHGVEVVIAEGAAAAARSRIIMGQETRALASARANIDAWEREIDGGGLDAIIDQRIGLRHDGQGLRLHVPQRSGLGRARRRASRRWRRMSANSWPSSGSARRSRAPALTSPIIPPARCSTGSRSTASRRRCSPGAGFRVTRACRGASLLRLGRHLQHPAARDRDGARTAQGDGARRDRRRPRRHRQYRLHRAARPPCGPAGAAYGGAAGLGDRRAHAAGAARRSSFDRLRTRVEASPHAEPVEA